MPDNDDKSLIDWGSILPGGVSTTAGQPGSVAGPAGTPAVPVRLPGTGWGGKPLAEEAQTTRELVDQLGPGDSAIIFYQPLGGEGYYYQVRVDANNKKTIAIYDPSQGFALGKYAPLDWKKIPTIEDETERATYLTANLTTATGQVVIPPPLQVVTYEGRLWRYDEGTRQWINEGAALEDPEASFRLQQRLADYQFQLNVRRDYYGSEAARERLETEIQAQADAAELARDFTAQQTLQDWQNRAAERLVDFNRSVILQGMGDAATMERLQLQLQAQAANIQTQIEAAAAEGDLDRQADLQKQLNDFQQQMTVLNQQQGFAGTQGALGRQQEWDILAAQQGFTGEQNRLARQQELALSLLNIQSQQGMRQQEAQMDFLSRLIPEMKNASGAQKAAMLDYLEETGFPIRQLAETFPSALPRVVQAMTQRTPQAQGVGAPFTAGGMRVPGAEQAPSPEEMALNALLAQVTNQQAGPNVAGVMQMLAGLGAQAGAAGQVKVTLPDGNTVTVNSPAGSSAGGGGAVAPTGSGGAATTTALTGRATPEQVSSWADAMVKAGKMLPGTAATHKQQVLDPAVEYAVGNLNTQLKTFGIPPVK